MAAQAWLNQDYEMDEGLTWPATAPASGSSDHVPNPIFASTIVPDPAGWSDGFNLLATQLQKEDVKEPTWTRLCNTKSPEGGEITTTAGKGPSPDAGKAQSKTIRATVLEPLIQQCTWDKEQKKWITPATENFHSIIGILRKLPNSMGGKPTSSSVLLPTFTMKSPTPTEMTNLGWTFCYQCQTAPGCGITLRLIPSTLPRRCRRKRCRIATTAARTC